MKYSLMIAAKNEAKTIQAAIKSAKGADEIIVIDDGSGDDTAAVAKKLGAKVIKRTMDGFANQKNFGIDQTKNDWVLILDADERLTPELANEIIRLQPKPGMAGYKMAFRNYVGKKWLRHGGLYPDYHIRLINKQLARYGSRQIHEQIEANGQIERLNHDVIHLTYRDFSEYRQKVDRYAKLEAEADKERPSWATIFKTFYRKLIKEAGILDGWAGLRSAWLLTRYQIVKRRVLS